MVWLLLLHLGAITCWCALLLYLPVLTAADTGPGERRMSPLPLRHLFVHFATPVAVVAIVSGTLLFLITGTISGWLLAKLMVVCALVVCHALCGWLVLVAERNTSTGCGGRAAALALAAAAAMLILWLVLARPL